MNAARRFRVWGRVQGVGYRHFVWRRATELGLAGWVRNRADGSVELVAAGDPERLSELQRLLEEGPRFARVDRIETETSTEEPAGVFEVRSTT